MPPCLLWSSHLHRVGSRLARRPRHEPAPPGRAQPRERAGGGSAS